MVEKRDPANRSLRMLIACNQAILRFDDERKLMREICRVAVEVGGHRMAWVGLKRHDAAKTVEPVAWAGHAEGYFDRIRVSWADDKHGRGPTGSAVRLGKTQIFDDFRKDPRFEPWGLEAAKRGYRTSIAVPIVYEGDVLGALSIYSMQAGIFSRVNTAVLEELAGDLAIGMMALRARRRLRGLAAELTVAEERERRRLAEVLHDDLQQLLVGAKLALGPAARSRDQGARKAADSVRKILDQSIACSRNLTQELSPPVLADGLAASLDWLADEFAERHGFRVRLTTERRVDPAGEGAVALLYRCVRELLFNALKHGKVRAASVEARVVGGSVRIAVSDQGAGFDPSRLSARRTKTFGLSSIRDRVDLLGGRFQIDSAPGRGCRVTLWAPARSARRGLQRDKS